MLLNAYLIILLVAIFCSFNIALLYLVQAIRKKQFSFLASGLLLFSVCLIFYYYEVAALYMDYPQFLWWNAPLLYLIGPAFYLHVKSKIRWWDIFHLIPALYFLIGLIPFYTAKSDTRLEYYLNLYDPANYQPSITQYLFLLSIGAYCLAGFYKVRHQRSLWKEVESSNQKYRNGRRIQWLYLSIGITATLSFFVSFAMDFSYNYIYEFDYFVFFLLTLLMIALQVYFTQRGIKTEPVTIPVKPKTIHQDNGHYAPLMQQLQQLMEEQRLYRQPNLKINELADALGVSMHELSAGINQYHQNNFFDYINRLRVEDFKQALLKEENRNYTLMAIARESGFNSNSSLYRVFKKYEGCTPRQFLENHL